MAEWLRRQIRILGYLFPSGSASSNLAGVVFMHSASDMKMNHVPAGHSLITVSRRSRPSTLPSSALLPAQHVGQGSFHSTGRFWFWHERVVRSVSGIPQASWWPLFSYLDSCLRRARPSYQPNAIAQIRAAIQTPSPINIVE